MRRLGLLLVSLLISGSASAQSLVIHGHPQKSVYADPSEWPLVQGQCHWAPSNLKAQLFDLMGHALAQPDLGHIHLELSVPLYSEVDHAFVMPFTLKLYLTAGYVDQMESEVGYFVWDATHDWHTPKMNGDPNGLVSFTGQFVLDPARGHDDGSGSWYGPVSWNPHGWTRVQIAARLTLTNGAVNRISMTFPVYSTLHPEQPERAVPPQFAKQFRMDCLPYSPFGGNTFGSAISEVQDYIPLGPLSAGQDWPLPLFEYTYGMDGPEQPGTFVAHRDPDLHNGNPGIPLAGTAASIVLHANDFGTGVHKVSLAWDVKKADTHEESVSILQFPIVVASGVVPTPTCQDPAAPNVGGPLPCLPPVVDVCPNIAGTQATIPVGMVLQNGQCVTPPPPVPEWHSFTPSFFRLLDMLEVCDPTDHKCVVLGLAQP